MWHRGGEHGDIVITITWQGPWNVGHSYWYSRYDKGTLPLPYNGNINKYLYPLSRTKSVSHPGGQGWSWLCWPGVRRDEENNLNVLFVFMWTISCADKTWLSLFLWHIIWCGARQQRAGLELQMNFYEGFWSFKNLCYPTSSLWAHDLCFDIPISRLLSLG